MSAPHVLSVILVCVQSFVDNFRFFFPSPLKDNPLNPPYQGDGSKPLPPDKGGRGVQRTCVSAPPCLWADPHSVNELVNLYNPDLIGDPVSFSSRTQEKAKTLEPPHPALSLFPA